jgi:hypothetical protein
MTEELSDFDYAEYVNSAENECEKHGEEIDEDVFKWIYLIGSLNDGYEALGPYTSFETCMEDNEGLPGCAMLLFPPTNGRREDLYDSDGSFD